MQTPRRSNGIEGGGGGDAVYVPHAPPSEDGFRGTRRDRRMRPSRGRGEQVRPFRGRGGQIHPSRGRGRGRGRGRERPRESERGGGGSVARATADPDARIGAHFFFPRSTPELDDPEAVLVFRPTADHPRSVSGGPLRLASNCAYEVWEGGRYIGAGGHRCVEGEAFVDEWTPSIGADAAVEIRLHYLHPSRAGAGYRCAFAQSFLADLDADAAHWKCWADASYRFGVEMSPFHLPRQNVVACVPDDHDPDARNAMLRRRPLADLGPRLRGAWRLVPLPVARLSAVPLGPLEPVAVRTLAPSDLAESGPESPDGATVPKGPADCWEAVKRRRRPLRCATYDLGRIALHRFDIRVESGTGGLRATPLGCTLCYTEVADIERAWTQPERDRVRLCDRIEGVGRASPIGVRGCRYVHVFSADTDRGTDGEDGGEEGAADSRVSVRVDAHRLEYPLVWKDVAARTSHDGDDGDDAGPGKREEERADAEAVLEACRRTLLACVDGGLVDSAWKARGQWAGDARMAAKALRALAENGGPVVALALSQIAASYDPDTGMVQGCWPRRTPDARLEMPTWHLAWALAVAEHTAAGCDPPLAPWIERVVLRSIAFWKARYLNAGGLVAGVRGWCFADWARDDPYAVGRVFKRSGRAGRCGGPAGEAHAVVNAWFHELCARRGIASGISGAAFESAFATPDGGYALCSRLRSGRASPHATAVAIGSGIAALSGGGREADALRVLRADVPTMRERVTPYFGWFVANALARAGGRDEALRFVRWYYAPLAAGDGTLREKCFDDASMAHAWSVGVAEFLVSDTAAACESPHQ